MVSKRKEFFKEKLEFFLFFFFFFFIKIIYIEDALFVEIQFL